MKGASGRDRAMRDCAGAGYARGGIARPAKGPKKTAPMMPKAPKGPKMPKLSPLAAPPDMGPSMAQPEMPSGDMGDIGGERPGYARGGRTKKPC